MVRSGSSGTVKKRAVIAVARKMAVLLHKLWRSGEVYEADRRLAPLPEPAKAEEGARRELSKK